MPRKSPMSPAEMDSMNLQTVTTSNLYDKGCAAAERISQLVKQTATEIAALNEPIELGDYETVHTLTMEYVDSCARTGAIPSKSGLARALGWSRWGVDKYCKNHPDAKSAQFLEVVTDGFSQILADSALSGLTQPVVSIFLEKAIYGYRDTATIEVSQAAPDKYSLENFDSDELAKQYIDAVTIATDTNTNTD